MYKNLKFIKSILMKNPNEGLLEIFELISNWNFIFPVNIKSKFNLKLYITPVKIIKNIEGNILYCEVKSFVFHEFNSIHNQLKNNINMYFVSEYIYKISAIGVV